MKAAALLCLLALGASAATIEEEENVIVLTKVFIVSFITGILELIKRLA